MALFTHSLSGKLSLAFAAFGLGVILLAGAFGIWNAAVESNRRDFEQRDLPALAREMAVFYEDHDESWETEKDGFPLPPFAMLLDTELRPIGRTARREWLRRRWMRHQLPKAAIVKDGRVVGFLEVLGSPPEHSLRDMAGAARSPAAWIGFGAILLTAGVSGTYVSRRMTRPLRDLTKATRAVSAGDLEHRVPVRTQDEFGVLARSFNEMNSKLKTSQEQQRRMTQDIVHDLAQPLLVIRGLAESMEEGVIPKSADNLRVIRQEADRLEALTRNLHFLEQADSNRLRMNMEIMHPGELLSRFDAIYRETARRADVELQVDAAPDLPSVQVDAERMIQVLSNLAANALQHGADGRVVTLAAYSQEDQVRLEMTDAGPGVDEADLPRIFERFHRADAARSPVSGGSGIGLAIVKSLVEAQGGRVWAEAVAPQGLRIVISLSACPPEGPTVAGSSLRQD